VDADRHEEVLRLQITVHHASLVDVLDAADDLQHDSLDALELLDVRQRVQVVIRVREQIGRLVPEPRERAVLELHVQVVDPVGLLDPPVEKSKDVRMREFREDLGFTNLPLIESELIDRARLEDLKETEFLGAKPRLLTQKL
jgi:hypothetical protein